MPKHHETETTVRRRISPWIKWAAPLAGIAAIATAWPFVVGMTNVAAQNLPVVVDHEKRIAAIEQSSVTNDIIMNERFDREDARFDREEEHLQRIENILLGKQRQVGFQLPGSSGWQNDSQITKTNSHL